MRGRVSLPDPASKERSDKIDRILEEDNKKYKRECGILVLGSERSGKMTVIKQLKIVHQDGFSDAELAEYRPVIYKNILDSANAVVLHMKKIGLECIDVANGPLAEKIIKYHFDLQNKPPYVSAEIAEAIHELWKDPIITKIMDEHSSEFYLMDSAPYFFSEVLRIGTLGYLPNETDVLRSHQQSGVGIRETQFRMGTLLIRMFDTIGPWTRWMKSIHYFETVNSIIFCTALDEYDQVSPDEQCQNRLLESIALFESVVNSKWFLRTSIFLFLTKKDEFKNKLPKVPLEAYFPDYTSGSDVNKATKFVLWKFMQMNRARLSVYPHLVEVSDTTNIRLVFAAVKEVILQNALKDSGIL